MVQPSNMLAGPEEPLDLETLALHGFRMLRQLRSFRHVVCSNNSLARSGKPLNFPQSGVSRIVFSDYSLARSGKLPPFEDSVLRGLCILRKVFHSNKPHPLHIPVLLEFRFLRPLSRSQKPPFFESRPSRALLAQNTRSIKQAAFFSNLFLVDFKPLLAQTTCSLLKAALSKYWPVETYRSPGTLNRPIKPLPIFAPRKIPIIFTR